MTCTVGALLQRSCATTPAGGSNTPPASQSPSTAPAPAPSQSSPSAQPVSSEPTTVIGPAVEASPAPLELEAALAGELPGAGPLPATHTATYQYPAHVLLSLTRAGNNTGVLGTTTTDSVLEATEQGWRFLGMLWYWWVIMIGGIIGLAALIKTTVTDSFFNIVKQP